MNRNRDAEKDSVCNNFNFEKGFKAFPLKRRLTVFAFALLYQVLVLHIVVATLAEEPGPEMFIVDVVQLVPK